MAKMTKIAKMVKNGKNCLILILRLNGDAICLIQSKIFIQVNGNASLNT